jgi:hypothetical protein
MAKLSANPAIIIGLKLIANRGHFGEDLVVILRRSR